MSEVVALVHDVFGTVVDWRAAVAADGEALARRKGISGVDWTKFADAWRGEYAPSMNRVRTGELPWTDLDADRHATHLPIVEFEARRHVVSVVELDRQRRSELAPEGVGLAEDGLLFPVAAPDRTTRPAPATQRCARHVRREECPPAPTRS